MNMPTQTLQNQEGDVLLRSGKQPFNLLRWFSLISMAVIGTVAVARCRAVPRAGVRRRRSAGGPSARPWPACTRSG